MARHLRQNSFSKSIWLSCAALAILLKASAAEPNPGHVRNFGRVDETLYRGGEPSPVGLEELQRLGVKLVIDLRESSGATLRERDQAQQLHMQYLNIPLAPWSAPSREDVRRLLVLLDNRGTTPVFIHCRRGKDRTGTIVACYRIQYDGWSNAKALAEADKYGMSWAERAMRSFVLHFAAFPKSAPDLMGTAALAPVR